LFAPKEKQSPKFLTFKEPKSRFQGINSARLCRLAGQYDNTISGIVFSKKTFLLITLGVLVVTLLKMFTSTRNNVTSSAILPGGKIL
jgi:hypothetical protein